MVFLLKIFNAKAQRRIGFSKLSRVDQRFQYAGVTAVCQYIYHTFPVTYLTASIAICREMRYPVPMFFARGFTGQVVRPQFIGCGVARLWLNAPIT